MNNSDYVFCNEKDPIQERLEESMPWIGRYILAASIICTLAMAADAFNGFRRRKLWFPCKYFSLNAASLTVLGVAMKLPMDLTTVMIYKKKDLAAKISSIIFMSTAIGNFMSSLGSMNDKEILPNVLALGILVVTIAVDVLIQLVLLWDFVFFPWYYYIFSTVSMLLCLAMLVSLAITVPTTKRSLETKYQEKHRVAQVEKEVLELERRGNVRNDNRKGYMMKYWVMAQTSSPQFVMARSVVSTTSAVICLISAIVLAFIYLDLFINPWLGVVYSIGEQDQTPYQDSPILILHVQSVGVSIGTIAPVLRWFVVVRFKCSTTTTNYKNFGQGFKVEAYWTRTLVDWRDKFSGLRINRQPMYFRKCLHDAKWYAITFCIRLQYVIVLLSKLLVYLSALLMTPFFVMKQKRHEASSSIGKDDMNYLRSYVLLLEDEPELPTSVLRNIIREGDKMIQAGSKKQPKSIIHLLKKFGNFNGVGQFDSGDQIPNCWTLPVVTLTSIAIALPNTTKHNSEQLLSSVSEGLSLAKIVDKTLVENTQLVNIRKAADICWVGVVLYMKWFQTDLRRISLECKDSQEVLEKLSNKAQGIVKDSATQDPLNWPPEVVAANSMFRISQTILLSCDEDAEGLFKRISVMIADILAACFTNLPHVINKMCHHNAIEKREKSAREAFRLLGETEQIIELLQQKEWPFSDHDKAASIQEWYTLFKGTLGSISTVTAVSESEDRLDVIKVEC